MPTIQELNHQLLVAAINADSAAVKELLENTDIDVNTTTSGFTALMLASMQPQVKPEKSQDENTNLENAYTEIVKLLLATPEINVNLQDKDGNNAAMLALGQPALNQKLTNALLEHKELNINTSNSSRQSAMIITIINNHFLSFNKIKTHPGVDINTQDKYGLSGLSHAINKNLESIISDLLLDNRTNIDIPDNSGNTPLMFASDLGRANIILQLLESGANPELRDKDGKTAQEIALKNGHKIAADCFILHELIKEHGLPNVINQLVLDESYEHLKIVTHNINYNKPIDDATGTTEIINAAATGQHKWTKALIALGADVNSTDLSQCNALMKAVENDDLDTVTLLIDNNANLNHKDLEDRTALMIATKNENPLIFSKLLQNSTLTQINATDKNGLNAFHHAHENNRDEIKVLINERITELGGEINEPAQNNTPLQTVALDTEDEGYMFYAEYNNNIWSPRG